MPPIGWRKVDKHRAEMGSDRGLTPMNRAINELDRYLDSLEKRSNYLRLKRSLPEMILRYEPSEHIDAIVREFIVQEIRPFVDEMKRARRHRGPQAK